MPNSIDQINQKIDAAGSQLKILINGKAIFNRLKFTGRQFYASSDKYIMFHCCKTVVCIDKIIICTYNNISQSFETFYVHSFPAFIEIKRNKNKCLNFFCWIKSAPKLS